MNSARRLFHVIFGFGGSLFLTVVWQHHSRFAFQLEQEQQQAAAFLAKQSTSTKKPLSSFPSLSRKNSHSKSNNNIVEKDVGRSSLQVLRTQRAVEQTTRTQQEEYNVDHDDADSRYNENISNLMQCDKDTSVSTCCVSWEVDTDEWWAHHVAWLDAPTLSNTTHQCFARVTNATLVAALQRVYQNQWNRSDSSIGGDGGGGNIDEYCSHSYQRLQVSSGYGASFSVHAGMMTKLIQYSEQSRPYVLTKHKADYRWLYATKDNSSWAYCPTYDINCYIVPYVACPQRLGSQDERIKQWTPVDFDTSSLAWAVRQYLSRYRHAVRYRIQQQIESWPPFLPDQPCTVMHVRRGDAGSLRARRRYVPLSEYIAAGNLTPSDPIVLLTDDQSTLDEIQNYYPNYQWWYPPRRRVRAMEGGFDGHTPNGPETDFVTMLAELQVASQCKRLVHGDSGFTRLIIWAMQDGNNIFHPFESNQQGTPIETYRVQTEITKKEAEAMRGGKQLAESMLAQIEQENQARILARQKTQQEKQRVHE